MRRRLSRQDDTTVQQHCYHPIEFSNVDKTGQAQTHNPRIKLQGAQNKRKSNTEFIEWATKNKKIQI
jgi:hypothetical protein